MVAKPVQFTVPALVSGASTYTVPLPLMFITPPGATVNGPPSAPPVQFIVPASTFVPSKVAPTNARLVMAPP